jgi:hypothetical protein
MVDMEKEILRRFQEDYPSSAQFRGGRALRKGGWQRIFPEIERDPRIKDDFISAAEDLEKKGVLSIQWARHRRGDRIEALYLENPRLLHELLGVPAPEDQREESLRLLADFRWEESRPAADPGSTIPAAGSSTTSSPPSDFLPNLLDHLRGRLEAFIPTPCGEPEQLRDLLTLLKTDQAMIAELPLRALSVRLYRDSKRLEALLPEADRLAMSAAGEKLSTRFGLSRNYPLAGLRGSLELILSDGQAWKLKGEALFLGPELVERLAVLSSSGPLLIVENKETFMTLPASDYGFDGLMYGGGHLNPATTALIQRAERSGIELHYFGDLDPDGLLIFQEAEKVLAGPLRPWHMDVETYLRYVDYGYPLSEGSIARLRLLRSGHFDDLAPLIESHGLGVEQELIDPAG